MCRFVQKLRFKGSCQFLGIRNTAGLYRDDTVWAQACRYLIETPSYSCPHPGWATLTLDVTPQQEGRKWVLVAIWNSQCWEEKWCVWWILSAKCHLHRNTAPGCFTLPWEAVLFSYEDWSKIILTTWFLEHLHTSFLKSHLFTGGL